ncbi:MAG: BatA domain-containing protein, partial [Planctomycetia bacterium]|nr:BatA domain-containing protein [Planctomycetia bacterium]
MLPHFVQPAFLWALLGLAIPVIIHLLFRRKSRRVDLGTLRFLRIVLEENARRRKLKRWLLLALRLGCLALIAGLFARPFFIDRGQSGRERLVAILIDRSASMELKDHGKRLIDLAVEQARDVIAKSGEKTQIEVAFFDQAVRPLGGGQSTNDKDAKPAELLALLKAPEVAYSATNYGAALAWARDVCTNNPDGRREVHIFTDLQRSGLDWTNVEPLPPEVEMHVVDLGRTAVNNVALTTVQAARRLVRPGDPVTLQAGVFNAGPFPLEKVPAVLTLESGSRKHVLREKV